MADHMIDDIAEAIENRIQQTYHNALSLILYLHSTPYEI
jgi:hypothetical protein